MRGGQPQLPAGLPMQGVEPVLPHDPPSAAQIAFVHPGGQRLQRASGRRHRLRGQAPQAGDREVVVQLCDDGATGGGGREQVLLKSESVRKVPKGFALQKVGARLDETLF